jgi:hypothetical protein
MKAFLGVNYSVKVKVCDDLETFVFWPSTKEIGVPKKFLHNYFEKIKNKDDE